MNRTVDLVIAGAGSDALAAAVKAVRERLQVLIVCRESNPALERLRRQFKAKALSVMCDATVVCVDGVGAPEAVVVEKSGRLIGVNTSRLLRFTSPRAIRPRTPASRSAELRRRRRGRRTPSPAES